MKLQAWFIILHLLEAVAGETSIDEPRRTSRTTAKVYMNLTGPLIPPRFNSDFNPKCNRPQEDPNLFRACHASGSPDFPAMHAICKCAQCDWEVLLKCQSDGAWYATEANVCTARYNCHKKCTIDELAKVESPVHCSYIKIGSLIKIHECRCKSNCLKTEVRCDETEGWVIDETPCRDFGVGRVKLEGNLTYLFQNGLYTYGCEPGFILDGNLTNRCDDGLLEGETPKCVAVAPVISKTADKETTAQDFEESTWDFIYTSVAFITVFCISLLLTLALIGCGAWILRFHNSRRQKVTSPASEVPTPPTRIIATLAPNPTDPAYLELMVDHVTPASTNGPTSSTPAMPTNQVDTDGYLVLEPIQGTSGSAVIPIRPGDPNSTYADVLNLENNQVIAEYDYIRVNGRKV